MNLIDRIRLFFDRRRDAYTAPSVPATTPPVNLPTRPQAFTPNRWLPEQWPSRVLFICSGNICRSAYAGVVFKRLLEQTSHHTQIMSAGTLRISGRMAASNMIKVAAEYGDDLTEHRSTPLSAPLLQASDIIFIMSPEHERACIQIVPACKNIICYLSHWLEPPALEIPDPMGLAYDAYQRAARQINEALKNWFEHAQKQSDAGV